MTNPNPTNIEVEEARADGMYQFLKLLDKAKTGEVDKATALEWLKGHQATIHQQGVLSERERLIDYVEHGRECVRNTCYAGRPTKDGGYEQKFGNRWYRSFCCYRNRI